MLTVKILNMPGYNKSETFRLYGYESPCKSLDFVVVNCRNCNNIFNKKVKYLRPFLDKGFNCKECAAKSRGEFLRGGCKRDWSVIADSLLGYSSKDTFETFGYMYPKKGLDKIALRCVCNEIAN